MTKTMPEVVKGQVRPHGKSIVRRHYICCKGHEFYAYPGRPHCTTCGTGRIMRWNEYRKRVFWNGMEEIK